MVTKSTYDFTKLRPLLDSAGITIEEASHLFRTTKPTMYSWCNGNGPNQALLLSSALKLVVVIERAVEAKALPVRDLEKPQRLPAITAVLRKYLNG